MNLLFFIVPTCAITAKLLKKDECADQPCLNGGTCLDSFGQFICLCTSGWQGKRCDQDVDECKLYSDTALGCQNGARCINTAGSFHCECSPGYAGVHCHNRLQGTNEADICSMASDSALCGFGSCVPVASAARNHSNLAAYTCVCDAGWTIEADSGACIVDVDECEQHREWLQQIQLSNYTAVGSDSIGTLCSLNPPVECINFPGSFRCASCPSGFVGNGQVCVDVNECETDNGGCSQSPLVPCINTHGGRVCGSCPVGFTGDGQQCALLSGSETTDADLTNLSDKKRVTTQCPVNQCSNGGVCVTSSVSFDQNSLLQSDNESQPLLFRCVCPIGFGGQRCEQRLSACQIAESDGRNVCQNNSTCIDHGKSFYCLCAEGWSGIFCETAESVCGHQILVKPSGSVRFPTSIASLIPNKRNQIVCKWTIKAPPGFQIVLKFRNFSIEKSTRCESNHLTLTETKPNSQARRVIGD